MTRSGSTPHRACARSAWLALGAWLVLAACGGEAADPRPDVWLVSVDTLRPDRLGFSGTAGASTPHMDRLAREGVVFTDAQTPIPRTTQSLASLFTAKYPPEHGVLRIGDSLAPEELTLAERFRDAGYWTGAVSANSVASPAQGLGQGFRVFSDAKMLRKRYGVRSGGIRGAVPEIAMAEAVTREAQSMLESSPIPRLLWVHYMDPHFMYNPPAPYNQVVDWSRFHFYRDRLRHRPVQASTFFDLHGLSKRDLPALSALYDAEISYVDHWIGQLLASVRRETLVVFTSDHGESLGEHGYYFEHGDLVYRASMAIPLVFWWPGSVAAGVRIEAPVSLLDILPTLSGLLDLSPADAADFAGADLSPHLRGDSPAPPAAERVHFGMSGEALLDGNSLRDKGAPPWTMVRRGRWKLIRIPRLLGASQNDQRPGVPAVRFELYDVDSDPDETANRASDEPEIVVELARLLNRWSRDAIAREPTPEMGPELEAELRALGYLE